MGHFLINIRRYLILACTVGLLLLPTAEIRQVWKKGERGLMLSGERIRSATRTPFGRMLGMLFWLGVVWCLSITVVWAETVYVSDEIKLTVRSGPGTDRKISWGTENPGREG